MDKFTLTEGNHSPSTVEYLKKLPEPLRSDFIRLHTEADQSDTKWWDLKSSSLKEAIGTMFGWHDFESKAPSITLYAFYEALGETDEFTEKMMRDNFPMIRVNMDSANRDDAWHANYDHDAWEASFANDEAVANGLLDAAKPASTQTEAVQKLYSLYAEIAKANTHLTNYIMVDGAENMLRMLRLDEFTAKEHDEIVRFMNKVKDCAVLLREEGIMGHLDYNDWRLGLSAAMGKLVAPVITDHLHIREVVADGIQAHLIAIAPPTEPEGAEIEVEEDGREGFVKAVADARASTALDTFQSREERIIEAVNLQGERAALNIDRLENKIEYIEGQVRTIDNIQDVLLRKHGELHETVSRYQKLHRKLFGILVAWIAADVIIRIFHLIH